MRRATFSACSSMLPNTSRDVGADMGDMRPCVLWVVLLSDCSSSFVACAFVRLPLGLGTMPVPGRDRDSARVPSAADGRLVAGGIGAWLELRGDSPGRCLGDTNALSTSPSAVTRCCVPTVCREPTPINKPHGACV